MKSVLKASRLALLIFAATASAGCYVTQDSGGQWWACEDIAAPNGVATACTPIDKPF